MKHLLTCNSRYKGMQEMQVRAKWEVRMKDIFAQHVYNSHCSVNGVWLQIVTNLCITFALLLGACMYLDYINALMQYFWKELPSNCLLYVSLLMNTFWVTFTTKGSLTWYVIMQNVNLNKETTEYHKQTFHSIIIWKQHFFKILRDI